MNIKWGSVSLTHLLGLVRESPIVFNTSFWVSFRRTLLWPLDRTTYYFWIVLFLTIPFPPRVVSLLRTLSYHMYPVTPINPYQPWNSLTLPSITINSDLSTRPRSVPPWTWFIMDKMEHLPFLYPSHLDFRPSSHSFDNVIIISKPLGLGPNDLYPNLFPSKLLIVSSTVNVSTKTKPFNHHSYYLLCYFLRKNHFLRLKSF